MGLVRADEKRAMSARTGNQRNASEAIQAYLDRWDLDKLVVAILGRSCYRPNLMKPHPLVVEAASTSSTSTPPTRCSSETP